MQKFIGPLMAALLGLASPALARSVHLTNFRGLYRGTVEVTLSGQNYPGVARIVVRTSDRGQSAIMIVSGNFKANGHSFPISNRINFSPSRIFAERSITNGFPGTSVAVTAPYSVHKRRLTFNSPFTMNHASGTAMATARIRPGRHGKLILGLNTSVRFDGQPSDYFFNFQVSKNLEP